LFSLASGVRRRVTDLPGPRPGSAVVACFVATTCEFMVTKEVIGALGEGRGSGPFCGCVR